LSIKQEVGRLVEQDRRVRRTRKLLHDAFLSLVGEKGYEKLTIQDILDRADIGRSTFYVHYRDKESLLLACLNEMGERLRGEMAATAPAGSIDVSRPAAFIFEHAYRNQQTYRALCGKQGGALVQRFLHGLVGDMLREHLPREQGTAAELPTDVAAEFYAAAALGLLTWWIENGFCRDPAWLTDAYRKLAVPERSAP
jgi:AcrR family transcriptional regulator